MILSSVLIASMEEKKYDVLLIKILQKTRVENNQAVLSSHSFFFFPHGESKQS